MEVVSGIHRIDGVNGNAYLVGVDDLALIDTGMPNNDGRILKYLEGLGRKPKDIKTIIITHGHVDHTGSLDAMKKATGAKVAAHRKDADVIAGRKQIQRPKGGGSLLLSVVAFFFKVFKAKPVQPDILLDDGDKIAGLTVLHVPGHTPGSIALIDKKRRAIFVGDTLRVGKGGIEAGPKRFCWDEKLEKESNAKISRLDFDILLSGHGEPLMPEASKKVREFVRSGK